VTTGRRKVLLARLCAITEKGKTWCERARAWADVQSLQYEARSMSCARRAKGSVKLRSLMVLSTHGSGRARGEREEQAGAQSLQCVVSSISCACSARRAPRHIGLRSPMVLSTHGSGRARESERSRRAHNRYNVSSVP